MCRAEGLPNSTPEVEWCVKQRAAERRPNSILEVGWRGEQRVADAEEGRKTKCILPNTKGGEKEHFKNSKVKKIQSQALPPTL